MSQIIANLHQVQEDIKKAAFKVGRNPAEITMIAVTKTVPVAGILPVVETGVLTLGENRVQELTEKYPQLPEAVQWHLIGHLQTNKVKYIIDKVKLVHSLDRLSLAQELNSRGEQAGIVVNTLVQVNVAGEDTKFGLALEEVRDFIEEISTLPFIKVRGLMTIGPMVNNPEEIRPVFRELKAMAERFQVQKLQGFSMGNLLSMGMSNDFAVAIEEGANLVRVGSRIFGARTY